MTSKPCDGRSRSRMICGRRRLQTYEHTVNLNPGYTSSVTAAPPRTWRRSRTSTRLPARARYAAVVRPLWPPPITMASYCRATMPDLIQGASRRAILVGRGGPRAVTGEGLYRLFAVRVRPEEERATRFTVSFADIGDLR